VDALKNEKVVSNPEKTGYFIDIIKEENKRMNKQVETILQAALLDRKEVQLDLKMISIHQLIVNAVKNITLPLQEKNGKIELHLDAASDMIMADELHMANIIGNMLDNAIKYAKPEGVMINISTKNVNKKIQLSIKDNGIGMSKETLSRIFEKFYRAHTGNIHNVKGFGLGLSYVKSVVEAHNGIIKPESSLGIGSNFIISFPLAS
jgi:two-component system phosphate regulon sensor histidine kinase PhoR